MASLSDRRACGGEGLDFQPSTFNPKPSTLNPQTSTLNQVSRRRSPTSPPDMPTPYPSPFTPHPTLHPSPEEAEPECRWGRRSLLCGRGRCKMMRRRGSSIIDGGRSRRPWLVANRATLPPKWPPPPRNKLECGRFV
jgi:hypothetical protein